MATYKVDLTLTSADLTSDNMSISASISDATANYGGIVRQLWKYNTATAFLDKDAYTEGAYVYICNADSAGTVTVGLTAGTEHMVLAAGEWAMFPWGDRNADIILHTDSASGRKIEWGVFN